MTRTIPKEQILPGMTIAWDKKGFTYTCEVTEVQARPLAFAMMVRSPLGGIAYVYSDTVEVIAEPQPEEPQWPGAKVIAGNHKFLRCGDSDRMWRRLYDDGVFDLFWDWEEVCRRGDVVVIPDNGWELPGPRSVPEWPEGSQ